MTRKNKNIITSCILVVLIGLMVLTMHFAGKSIASSTPSMEFNNSSEMGTPPEKPDGDSSSMEEPPTMNNDNTEATTDENAKSGRKGPRERNSSDNENTNGEEPPEKPDGESSQMVDNQPENMSEDNSTGKEIGKHSNNSMMPMDMNNMPQVTESSKKLNVGYYMLFAIEGLLFSLTLIYLIMSKFNKKSFQETFKNSDKIIILALATTVITSGITYIDGILSKTIFSNNKTIETQSTVAKASTTVTSKETLTDTYTSTNSDESAIIVKDGGKATIKNATINKKKGDTTNTEDSDFYGVNAGILVQKGSKATIKKVKIKTNAKGGNAVFATGTDAVVSISDSTIETTGSSSSRGLDATYGGYIDADNVTIKTTGNSSATLATDRGEGTVIAKNSNLETNGNGSPLIYSTGDISVDNTEGVSNSSQIVVVEGKNKATVTNSKLAASGKGNRGDVDQAGVMIYQSMSGDAAEGVGTFTAENSELTITSDSDNYKTAPMFFITNTQAQINLTNTKLSYGSNILLKIMGTEEWGKTGSNGGDVTVTATNQELIGDIEIDNISTLTLNLEESSYEGTINSSNEAKEIKLVLDKNSTIKLTGDSYITALENLDDSYSNIDFNGYTLYVNGVAIK